MAVSVVDVMVVGIGLLTGVQVLAPKAAPVRAYSAGVSAAMFFMRMGPCAGAFFRAAGAFFSDLPPVVIALLRAWGGWSGILWVVVTPGLPECHSSVAITQNLLPGAHFG